THDEVIEAFQANGTLLHDARHFIGTGEDIGPAQYEQHAFSRALDEAAGSFQRGSAGTLGADQRTRDVEAVFGQKVVEVVAGHTAWNIGILAAHMIAESIGDGL